MSQFIDKLEIVTTREWALKRQRLTMAVTETPIALSPERLNKYLFQTQWTAQVTCSQEDLAAAHKNVIRQLTEAVYGSFRDRLLKLEIAIYEDRQEDVKSGLRDILRELYP